MKRPLGHTECCQGYLYCCFTCKEKSNAAILPFILYQYPVHVDLACPLYIYIAILVQLLHFIQKFSVLSQAQTLFRSGLLNVHGILGPGTSGKEIMQGLKNQFYFTQGYILHTLILLHPLKIPPSFIIQTLNQSIYCVSKKQ